MKGYRKQDSAKEAMMAEFMDEYGYPGLKIGYPDICSDKFSCERTRGEVEQLSGSDIVFFKTDIEQTNKMIVCDEKAMISTKHLNKIRSTFALELGSIQNGIFRLGWFVMETLITKFFIFIKHIVLHGEKNELECAKDIESVLVFAVKKRRISEFLYKYLNLTSQNLIDLEQKVRRSGKHGGHYIEGIPDEYREKVYLYFSTHLKEQPINIVIHDDVWNILVKERGKLFYKIERSGITPFPECPTYENYPKLKQSLNYA